MTPLIDWCQKGVINIACYHPLKAFWNGEYTAAGKKKYEIAGYNQIEGLRFQNVVEIPCGKCLGCRLDYSRTWANRCLLESKLHEHNYFVTLTYDNDNLPHGETVVGVDYSTGEAYTVPNQTLCKRDFQLFMKRLRKYFGKVRFFACGEYGDETLRPHYHVLLFGLNGLDDLTFYKTTKNGDLLYNSDKLFSVWQNGFAVIGECTWKSCAYTARYVVKKAQKKVDYSVLGLEPEFVTMSRRPGIGRDCYSKDFFNYDYVSVPTSVGGVNISSNRYFDKILELDDPDMYFDIKEKRKHKMESLRALKSCFTDNDYLESLHCAELNKEVQVRALSRDNIITI